MDKTDLQKQFEEEQDREAVAEFPHGKIYLPAYGEWCEHKVLNLMDKAEAYDRLMSGGLTMKELANILKHPVAIENDEGQNTLYYFSSTPHIGQFSDGTQFWSCKRKWRLPRQLVNFYGDWKDSLTLPDNWEATNEKD